MLVQPLNCRSVEHCDEIKPLLLFACAINEWYLCLFLSLCGICSDVLKKVQSSNRLMLKCFKAGQLFLFVKFANSVAGLGEGV